MLSGNVTFVPSSSLPNRRTNTGIPKFHDRLTIPANFVYSKVLVRSRTWDDHNFVHPAPSPPMMPTTQVSDSDSLIQSLINHVSSGWFATPELETRSIPPPASPPGPVYQRVGSTYHPFRRCPLDL